MAQFLDLSGFGSRVAAVSFVRSTVDRSLHPTAHHGLSNPLGCGLWLSLLAPLGQSGAGIRLSPCKPLIVDASVGEARLVVMAECPHCVSQAPLADLGQPAFPARTVVACQQFAGANRRAAATVGMAVQEPFQIERDGRRCHSGMDEARTLGLGGQRGGRTPKRLGLFSRCLLRCRTFRNLRRLRNLRGLRNLRKVHGDEGSQPAHLHQEGNEQYEAGLNLVDAGAGKLGQRVGLRIGGGDDRRSILQFAA